jgi:hypothetical protein
MPDNSAPHQNSPHDDILTLCAVSVVAAILADVLHEGVGHAFVALLTGAQSGLLTTVAWSSAFDSRLVAAGGTLVNIAAGLVFWIVLRNSRRASPSLRYFLLVSCAFNLFTGTGYFFFSGITNFGDWAVVIAGMSPHAVWRVLLVVLGVASYYASVRVVGAGIVRYLGVPLDQRRRFRKLMMVPYFSAILLLGVAGLLNPIGIQLVWQSALPATAGADSGLLWLRYYIPQGTVPRRSPEAIPRSSGWIAVAAILAAVFVIVLGRGITLHR